MFNLFNPFIQSEIKMKFNMIRKFLNLINLHAIIILSENKICILKFYHARVEN